MVVISYGTLRSYFEVHADAEDALNNWRSNLSNWVIVLIGRIIMK